MSISVEEKSPLYRLVDAESRSVLLTAQDVTGFYTEFESVTPGNIFLTGVRKINYHRGIIEWADLEVVNQRGSRIGIYHLSSVRLSKLQIAGLDGQNSDACSFYAYGYPYPFAGEIWKRWASSEPRVCGEWASFPVTYHSSWLHVVQTAWFANPRELSESGREKIVKIEGSSLLTREGFYCALGEAVNGPRGYFGSNLDGVADLLSASLRHGRGSMFRIEWKDFMDSQSRLGREFTSSALSVFEEFHIPVICA